MKTYVLYESVVDHSYTFFEEGSRSNIDLLEPDAELVWSVRAASWDIAKREEQKYLQSLVEEE